MKRVVATAVLALLTGCFPGSGSETSADDPPQVGRWVDTDTTTAGDDNVMGLLANGEGAAKIFYVDGSASLYAVTLIVTWSEAIGDSFGLQLRCDSRVPYDANGIMQPAEACERFESFDMTCPVPDAGDGAPMDCTSSTFEWQVYPFEWVRTPPPEAE